MPEGGGRGLGDVSVLWKKMEHVEPGSWPSDLSKANQRIDLP